MRNPDGTFAEGNPGRPKGARNKLSKAVIEAWLADVEEHGPEVIARLRADDPATYARISASLVDKQISLEADMGIREIVKEYVDGGEPE